MELDDITGAVVDEAIRIHRDLGPGLLESGYEGLLGSALQRRGLRVERQLGIDFSHENIEFKDGFRLDLPPAPLPASASISSSCSAPRPRLLSASPRETESRYATHGCD